MKNLYIFSFNRKIIILHYHNSYNNRKCHCYKSIVIKHNVIAAVKNKHVLQKEAFTEILLLKEHIGKLDCFLKKPSVQTLISHLQMYVGLKLTKNALQLPLQKYAH